MLGYGGAAAPAPAGENNCQAQVQVQLLNPSFFRCLQQPVHGAWADAVISGVQHVSRDIYRWQYDDLAAETIHEPNINAFQSWCYFYKQCLIATWTSETVSIYLKTNTILLWYIEPSVTCELEDNFYLF